LTRTSKNDILKSDRKSTNNGSFSKIFFAFIVFQWDIRMCQISLKCKTLGRCNFWKKFAHLAWNNLTAIYFGDYAIIRASIPSLFLRFVLILKVYILKKIIVLISKKCPYFWLASLFCLIFNNDAILRKPFSSWPKFFSVKALWHHKSNTILFGTQRSKAADRHEALLAFQAVFVRSEG